MAPGTIIAQMESYRRSFCTSRKVGIMPPLKNMVKAKYIEIIPRKGMSFFDIG